MSKKFTTTEYARIIKAWETSKGYTDGLGQLIKLLQDGIIESDGRGETTMRALALANPVTRELVYDDYVVESKFVWYDPNDDSVINTFDGGWYLDMHRPEDDNDEINSKFTEKEIAESPFRADYFKKVEVTD